MCWYEDFGDGMDQYDANEHTKIYGAIENVREVWLESVFGHNGKLTVDEWTDRVSKEENSWVFDASKLREKLFVTAGLRWRY